MSDVAELHLFVGITPSDIYLLSYRSCLVNERLDLSILYFSPLVHDQAVWWHSKGMYTTVPVNGIGFAETTPFRCIPRVNFGDSEFKEWSCQMEWIISYRSFLHVSMSHAGSLCANVLCFVRCHILGQS